MHSSGTDWLILRSNRQEEIFISSQLAITVKPPLGPGLASGRRNRLPKSARKMGEYQDTFA